MDGYEAMRLIRKDGRHKKLPVIALTVKSMKEDKEKCLEVDLQIIYQNQLISLN